MLISSFVDSKAPGSAIYTCSGDVTSDNIMTLRKAPRFKSEEPVFARWMNGGIHEGSGQTRDVSCAGMFFYAEFAPEDGSDIELMLTLPAEVTGSEAKTVLCRGRVVRVEAIEEEAPSETKYGVAVEMDSYDVVSDS